MSGQQPQARFIERIRHRGLANCFFAPALGEPNVFGFVFPFHGGRHLESSCSCCAAGVVERCNGCHWDSFACFLSLPGSYDIVLDAGKEHPSCSFKAKKKARTSAGEQFSTVCPCPLRGGSIFFGCDVLIKFDTTREAVPWSKGTL